jgi:hypothetical protein
MDNSDRTSMWYHGSPCELTVLRKGSTITQDRRLAEVFSHRPTWVSVLDDGSIKHDGTMPGFLYCVSEDIQPEDVVPHPRSTMERGKEWLTNGELRVSLIGPTQMATDERLTEEDIRELRRRLG